MTLTYRTDGAWGTGKGAPLTAAEVDGNFHGLDSRVTALETNPPSAVGIQSFQVVGTQLYVHMQDGDTFGPYTLPTAIAPQIVQSRSETALTLALADAGAWLRMTASGGATVTLPKDASVGISIGSVLQFEQVGGALTFAAESGATLIKRASKAAGTNEAGSVVFAKKVAANTWTLWGDLQAA